MKHTGSNGDTNKQLAGVVAVAARATAAGSHDAAMMAAGSHNAAGAGSSCSISQVAATSSSKADAFSVADPVQSPATHVSPQECCHQVHGVCPVPAQSADLLTRRGCVLPYPSTLHTVAQWHPGSAALKQAHFFALSLVVARLPAGQNSLVLGVPDRQKMRSRQKQRGLQHLRAVGEAEEVWSLHLGSEFQPLQFMPHASCLA